MIDIASFLDNGANGHDRFEIRRARDAVFVAVADGMTSCDHPEQAAQMAVDCAAKAFLARPRSRIQTLAQRFTREIASVAAKRLFVGSAATTLTAVVFQPDTSGSVEARYIALGDSPIYVAYPGPITEVYQDTYLALQIHGKPLQVENQGRVYSFVDCSAGLLVGRAAVGSFRLVPGDLCLVCTDGVPIQEHILRDLRRGTGSHRFFNEVTRDPESATGALLSRIRSTAPLGDDATLVAVAVRNPAVERAGSHPPVPRDGGTLSVPDPILA